MSLHTNQIFQVQLFHIFNQENSSLVKINDSTCRNVSTIFVSKRFEFKIKRLQPINFTKKRSYLFHTLSRCLTVVSYYEKTLKLTIERLICEVNLCICLAETEAVDKSRIWCFIIFWNIVLRELKSLVSIFYFTFCSTFLLPVGLFALLIRSLWSSFKPLVIVLRELKSSVSILYFSFCSYLPVGHTYPFAYIRLLWSSFKPHKSFPILFTISVYVLKRLDKKSLK